QFSDPHVHDDVADAPQTAAHQIQPHQTGDEVIDIALARWPWRVRGAGRSLRLVGLSAGESNPQADGKEERKAIDPEEHRRLAGKLAEPAQEKLPEWSPASHDASFSGRGDFCNGV